MEWENSKLKITVLDYFKNQECKLVNQLYIILELQKIQVQTHLPKIQNLN